VTGRKIPASSRNRTPRPSPPPSLSRSPRRRGIPAAAWILALPLAGLVVFAWARPSRTRTPPPVAPTGGALRPPLGPAWANLFTHGGIDEAKWLDAELEGELSTPDPASLGALSEFQNALSLKIGNAWVQVGLLFAPAAGVDKPTLFYARDGRQRYVRAKKTGEPLAVGDAGPPGTIHRVHVATRPSGHAVIELDGRELCEGDAPCFLPYHPGLGAAITKAVGRGGSVLVHWKGLRFREKGSTSWTWIDVKNAVHTGPLSIVQVAPGEFFVRGTL